MGPMWYILLPGGQAPAPTGPLTTAELHAHVAAGRVPDGAQLLTEDGSSTTLGAVRTWWDQSRGGRVAALAGAADDVVIETDAGNLRVSWPWRRGRPWVLFLSGFSALMVAVTAGIGLAVGDGVDASGLALLGLLAVALYASAAFLINRTTVTVEGDALQTRHGPLPAWRSTTRVALASVSELFVDGAGECWRLRAKRWQAPTVTLLVTKHAADVVAATRAVAAAVRQRGYQPLVSESPQQRAAHLLGWASPQAATLEAASPPRMRAPAGALKLPEATRGIDVERSASGALIVTRRWRTGLSIVVFAIWLVFAILLPLTPMLDGKPYEAKHLGAIPLMLACGYAPLALMFNRTRWTLSGATLDIRHGPIPWPGGRRVDLSAAVQIYCKDITGYERPYRVLELLESSGRAIPLWHYNVNLVPDAQVVAIERHLEQALGIVDRAVAGELQRGGRG